MFYLINTSIVYYILKRVWWLFWQFIKFGYTPMEKVKNKLNYVRTAKYSLKSFTIFDAFLIFFYKALYNAVVFTKTRNVLRYTQFYTKVYDKLYFFVKFNFKSNGFTFLWKNFRYWLLGVILACVVVYYFLVIRSLPFNKIMFEWFLVTMLFYWFISGFVFFIKKYRFSKFTTAIQRFWRRTFMIFWLIESFLFLIFIYLTINANQEPVYMYDSMQIYKTHLFSWRLFILKIFPIALLIIFSYFFLIILKWNIFSKNNIFFFAITLLLVYIVWLEFYQFFHVLNYYGSLFWIYDAEEHLWFLESEYRRTRINNHYVTICIIAKFWHLIFIFIFWVFFLLRGNETLRYRYPLFSANFYNFIFLYILSWVYMYPWYKFLLRRHLSSVYYWFFINPRHLFFRILFNDVKLVYFGFLNFFKNFFLINFSFLQNDFYYFISNSQLTNYCQYKKHFIRDLFLYNLH